VLFNTVTTCVRAVLQVDGAPGVFKPLCQPLTTWRPHPQVNPPLTARYDWRFTVGGSNRHRWVAKAALGRPVACTERSQIAEQLMSPGAVEERIRNAPPWM
jgi:hypothetical protein